jgi:glucosamine-phosphate N-acetyltransferase
MCITVLTFDMQTILDCSEANEGFYVKCGFKRAGLEMAHYYNKP